MNRYALFTWQEHDAGGGWQDFVTSADEVETLKDLFAKTSDTCTVGHIVDLRTMAMVLEAEWTYDPPAIVGGKIEWRLVWRTP